MSNSLILKNENFGEVRVAYKENEPLFCLSDVCKILDIQNTTDVKNAILREFELSRLNLHSFDTGFGVKEFTMIDEAQLYYVMNNSRSKNAKPFRMWVNKEVLPSIRKNGEYNLKIPKTYAEALLEAGRLALENEKLQALQIENQPKIESYNDLMETKDLIDFLEFSKIIKIGRTTLFSKLRQLRILMSDNMPYQEYITRGYFKCVENAFTQNNIKRIYTKTMITAKGQDYLVKKLKDN
ncbi:antirepressor, BRO family protein [Campylobacter coli]|nr:antirepressor, BRO family protein [Campylobacter coli]EFS5454637.1 antirepressor, BRO family protein [Campylobacter coli]EGC9796012.1 antirepressor, BRO family protein [Campylobacter coli]